MPSRHLSRVASRLKFLISHVLQRELNDPRIGFVTVLRVEPTADFREAKVFLSILGSSGERSKTLHALDDARGFIQRLVGKSLETRNVPALRFVLDDTQDHVRRIEDILRQAKMEDDSGG